MESTQKLHLAPGDGKEDAPSDVTTAVNAQALICVRKNPYRERERERERESTSRHCCCRINWLLYPLLITIITPMGSEGEREQESFGRRLPQIFLPFFLLQHLDRVPS